MLPADRIGAIALSSVVSAVAIAERVMPDGLLARSLGFLTINWNIDPRDWALPGVGAIEANVLANARNGGIVEMHFGGGPRYETLDSLPTIINNQNVVTNHISASQQFYRLTR